MYALNSFDLRLSAYLYEATNVSTYYDAAILSHEFMQSHPCKGVLGCFSGKSGSFDVRSCARLGGQIVVECSYLLRRVEGVGKQKR